MKRQFSIIACLALVIAMVLSFASCDLVNKVLGKTEQPEPEHTHSFVEGKCECGESDPNYVPPHTHNFVDGKCECGEADPDYNPVCEHQYGYEVTTEATCTVEGVKTFTCALCGDSYTQPIAPLGHTEEKVPGKAPTCTEPGLSDGKACSVCGEELVAQNEINATGHSFVEGTCTACGEIDPEYNGPKTYVLDVQSLTAFAQGAKADGDTESVADFFTIYYSAKTKIDTTKNKTWPDGYTVEEGLRLNWGGTTAIGETTKNAIEINVDGTATVKVWWICGGDGREIGIFDANGDLVVASQTDDVFAEGTEGVGAGKNGVYLSELALNASGTYYIGTDNTNAIKNGGNIICKVEVTVTPAEEAPKNEIKVETTDTYTAYDLDFFTFTATAEGYYTFKVPAGLGIFKDGANMPEIDFYDNANGYEFTIGLKADQEVKFWVSATTKDLWTIEWTFEEGEVKEDEPDTPIEGDATELVVGSNTVVFGEGELSEGKTYPFVVTEEGTYTFRCDLMAVIMDADGNTMGRGQAYLVPGNYTVALFSMMPMPANSFIVNITFEAPASGEPDGSEQYPYVWETLPESVVVDYDVITGKVYYIFTATADGSVTFTWPVEGDSWYDIFEIDENGNLGQNNNSGFMADSHSFVVEAGKSYRVSLGSWSEAGSHTIAISFVSCVHVWSEATCTTPSTCANCGATTGDTAEHTSTVAEPTCSNPDVCADCGEVIGYIDHAMDDGVVITPADCATMTDGSILYTCTVCGHEETETLWAYHEWDYSQSVEATCTTNGKYHAVCTVCGEIESYDIEAQGHYNYFASCGETTSCMGCGEEFTVEHDLFPADCFSPAMCSICWQTFGEPLTHNYIDGVCEYCYGVDPDYVPVCEHSYFYPCDPVCQECGELSNPDATHTIVHVDANAATCYENGNIEYWYCSDCGYAWADEALTLVTNLKAVVLPMAHAEATHVEAKDSTCSENGNIEYWYCVPCGQAWLDAECTKNTNLKAVILPTLDHDYVYGICSVCQAKDSAYVDYYLVGYINGADYGCEGDYANLGEYKFVDGKLTVTFNNDSYVFVKTGNLNGENVKWYLFESYHDASKTEGTLYENKSEKMFIPGNVEVIFTLTVNEDGTLTLSYHLHSYEAVVTDPTCTKKGYTTHTCSCGASYTDSEVDVIAHADENGDYKCDACSTKMLPADGEALTIPQALAIAKLAGTAYTTQKYYITGIVTNVYNTTYGNLYLKDAEGNEICIYGLYSADGNTRYDAMSYKPVEGDELTVYTVLGMYNTTCQGKNAWMDEVVAHEHDYEEDITEPTCVNDGYTVHTCSICKASYTDSEVEALGHTTENGECERCGLTIGGDTPVIGELARFDFGSNGSASHVDGNDYGASKSFTSGSQTLSLTGMSKVFGPAYDAKGNSCLKLGTSKLTGSFTFTVGENVTEVVIYVAGYKAATSTNIKINGTQYTVKTASNNGDYTAITIDTTTTKTITFTSVTYRCMIDAIVFNGVVA